MFATRVSLPSGAAVGLAAVWMSKRYSNDARWALTVMTALTMCLMSAVVIAALVMR